MREFLFPDAAFDARLTLIGSAQAFHWQEREGAFYAVSDGIPMRVRQLDAGIAVVVPEGCPEEALRRYFDLDRDYAAVSREYADYPCAGQAFEMLPGLRILRQPPWEALVSFLFSQNNNTARIGKLVRSTCEKFGARVEAFGLEMYAFPGPQQIAAAGAEAFRALGAGYRAEYLEGTARMVLDGFPLDALSNMRYEDAHARLMELPGVGPKVADCVLLFGCGHLSAYPVDVGVARLSRSWRGLEGKSGQALAENARARFGPHAGILQQYLFHCARCGLIET